MNIYSVSRLTQLPVRKERKGGGSKFDFNTFSIHNFIFIIFILGLPPQHLYYSPPDHTSHSPSSLHKYHENGQDSFSDFVSLVCQDGGGGPPGPSRSPKVSSYYSPSMYPPPPPMSRPVPLVRSTDMGPHSTSPPVSSSPGDHHLAYDLMPPILSSPHDGKYTSTF